MVGYKGFKSTLITHDNSLFVHCINLICWFFFSKLLFIVSGSRSWLHMISKSCWLYNPKISMTWNVTIILCRNIFWEFWEVWHGNIFVLVHMHTSRGIAMGWLGVVEPFSQKPTPPSPHEMTLCPGVYEEPPFWIQVVPLSPPPCHPLILKSLATPLHKRH